MVRAKATSSWKSWVHNSTSFPEWVSLFGHSPPDLLLFDSNVLELEGGKSEEPGVYLCSHKYELLLNVEQLFISLV